MLRLFAWLSTLLLLSLLSDSCRPLRGDTSQITTSSPRVETLKKNTQSGYINLRGQKLPWQQDSNMKKMIVLTKSSHKSVTLQAIRENELIDLPSRQVIDSMQLAFDRADAAKGNEQFFIVGQKGEISEIVEGTREEINAAVSNRAKHDLNDVKGDRTSYHIHTHGYREASDSLPYFLVTPSEKDTSNRNFRELTAPHVILSYRVDLIDINTGDVYKLGGEKDPKNIRYNYIPVIVFYNQKGPIVNQDFSDFKKLVIKHDRKN